MRKLNKSEVFSILIFFLVFLPFAILLILRTTTTISPNLINILFGLIQVSFSLFMLLVFFQYTSSLDHKFIGRLLAFILFILLPIISVLINDVNVDDLFRLIAIVFYIFNILVLFPKISSNLNTTFFKVITDLYILFSICLIALASYFHITNINPYTRIGYPLNSGVFAYYLLIAFCVSLFIKKRMLLVILFTGFIIASGSRATLILLISIMFLFSGLESKTKFTIALLSIIFISVLILLFNDELLYPYLVKRIDISSGRFFIWENALARLSNLKASIFGYGSVQTISGVGLLENRDYGTHNSFLDLALQYGIPFSIASYFYWFLFFLPKDRANLPEFRFRLAIFFIITSMSFFYNIFWLNMGDGATFISLIFLLCETRIPFSKQQLIS